jgi:hypothetical protein
MYPVVFFDALRVKIREDAVVRNDTGEDFGIHLAAHDNAVAVRELDLDAGESPLRFVALPGDCHENYNHSLEYSCCGEPYPSACRSAGPKPPSVSSDAHLGIKAAVAKVLKSTWQRCRVHFSAHGACARRQGTATNGGHAEGGRLSFTHHCVGN